MSQKKIHIAKQSSIGDSSQLLFGRRSACQPRPIPSTHSKHPASDALPPTTAEVSASDHAELQAARPARKQILVDPGRIPAELDSASSYAIEGQNLLLRRGGRCPPGPISAPGAHDGIFHFHLLGRLPVLFDQRQSANRGPRGTAAELPSRAPGGGGAGGGGGLHAKGPPPALVLLPCSLAALSGRLPAAADRPRPQPAGPVPACLADTFGACHPPCAAGRIRPPTPRTSAPALALPHPSAVPPGHPRQPAFQSTAREGAREVRGFDLRPPPVGRLKGRQVAILDRTMPI